MRWRQTSAVLTACLVLWHVADVAAFADEKGSTWEVRSSDPDREGRFLNVPIYYGDWIPIPKAKSIIESVASKIEEVQQLQVKERQDYVHQVPEVPEIDRVDVQEVPTADQPEAHGGHSRARLRPAGAWRKPAQATNNNNRRPPFRRQDNYRRQRKLPSGNSFVNQIASFFGAPQAPPPPPPPPPRSPPVPDNIPSESSFGLGNVFGLPTFFSQPKKPQVPFHQTNFGQPTHAVPVPIIKQVQAPDLTQNSGPPVIELGDDSDKGEGEIIFGSRLEQDHLSGFVPVNFEHITSGEPAPPRPRHPNQEHPKDFSVVLQGVDINPDPNELAKLFKEGKMNDEQTRAFIAPDSENVPDGFKKIKLPFMEHSEGVSELPSVFIAPVGFKVPKGYKGHPLPYDPAGPGVTVVHTEGATTTNLVSEVEPTEPTADKSNKYKSSATSIRDKIKLARQRPSLADFYKNKAKEQEDDVDSKKRRILTKIVRRPFKPKNLLKPFGGEDEEEEEQPVEEVVVEEVQEAEDEQTTVRFNPFTTVRPDVWVEVDAISTPESQDETLTTTLAPEDSEVEEEQVGTELPLETPEELVEEELAIEDTTRNDFFEPTTVHTEEPVEEHDYTTSAPPTPVQFVTEYTPASETTVAPELEETTTTTAFIPLSTTTSEEPEVTTASSAYEPTPFSNFRPLRRFDLLKYKNPLQRLKPVLPEALVPTVTTTQEPETTPKYERANFNKFENSFYGQRLRSRKKPNFWRNGFGQEETSTATTTTVEPATTRTYKRPKTEEYKKKFRPFFDELYDKLTKGEEEVTEPQRRPLRQYFGRRRSTTTPNPFTIDAEIYEIHPQSGRRVPTKTTTTPPDYVTEPVYEYEEQTEVPYLPEYSDYDSQKESNEETSPFGLLPSLPPLEYHEVAISTSTEPYEVPALPIAPEEQVQSETLPPLDVNTPYVYPEAPLNYDYVHNDLVDTDNSNLDFAESQQVQNTWNDFHFVPADNAAATPGRLDHYQKPEIAPSRDLAQQHDTGYTENGEPVVNEHSQQPVGEGNEFIPFLEVPQDERRPALEYVNIQRQPLPATAEQDIIYHDEESPEESLHSFSIPVVASVSVPLSVQDTTTAAAYAEQEEVTTQEAPVEREQLVEETAIDVEAPEAAPVEEETVTTEGNEQFEEDQEATTVLNKEIEVEDVTKYDSVSTEPQLIDETTTVETLEENVSEEAQVTITEQTELATTTEGGFLNSLLNYLIPTTTTNPELVEETTTEVPEVEATVPEVLETVTDVLHENEIQVETTTVTLTETPSEEEVTTTTNEVEQEYTSTEAVEATTVAEVEEATTEVEVETTEEGLEATEEDNEDPVLVPSLHRPSWLDKENKESPVKKFSPEKVNFTVKKREQLIKNWVSRKYKPQSRTTTAEPEEEEEVFSTTPALTTTSEEAESDVTEPEAENDITEDTLGFAPTVLPHKRTHVKDILNDRKQQLLDKYSNARKSQLKDIFPKPTSKVIKAEELEEPEEESERIPRGSNPNLFKSWEGDSLSQAEFERKVLGVSTATEVSVKSMICVRGRCFNADDMSGLIN